MQQHMAKVGNLMEGFSRVAAADPKHAWFPTAHDAKGLIAPTAGNRMVAYPYPKFACAVMDVDQAAAVLIMSEAEAACVNFLCQSLAADIMQCSAEFIL